MGWNNIPPYARSRDRDVQEAIGITQFNRENEHKYYHIVGGLVLQGGLLDAPGAVEFNAAYDKQVLGVFINGGIASAITLEGFTSDAAGYWFAIGV